jgi:hypothetical protein
MNVSPRARFQMRRRECVGSLAQDKVDATRGAVKLQEMFLDANQDPPF